MLEVHAAAGHEFERVLQRRANHARQDQPGDLARDLHGDLSCEERPFADASEHDPRRIDTGLLLQRAHGGDAVLHFIRKRACVVHWSVDHRPAARVCRHAAAFVAEEADAERRQVCAVERSGDVLRVRVALYNRRRAAQDVRRGVPLFRVRVSAVNLR